MDNFNDDEVAQIVRRAVELDADRADGHPAGTARLGRAALVDAATEVGIQRTAIELAIAEHAVGPPPSTGRLDPVFGPRLPYANRRVDLASDRVEAAIAQWLSRAQFQPQRREARRAVWNKRTDMTANAMRLAHSITGGERFRTIAQIEVRVVPVDAASSVVQLSGDRTAARNRALAVSSGFLAAGATAVIAGFVAIPALAVNALPCAAAAVGVALYSRRRTERTTSDLDRLLDQLAADERPTLLGRPRAVPRFQRRDQSAGATAPPTSQRPVV